jgi:hypothetical protein
MGMLDALAVFDCIGEHIPDMINPSDQVARSGWWVGGSFLIDLSICWWVVTALPSMTRQTAEAVDAAGIEPKRMSTGLARKSAMLSGKTTPLAKPSSYTKNLDSAPTWCANCQMVRSGQPTGVLISVVYLFGGEESKAKNSKVAHEYAEHREHSEFILVRATGE